MFDYQSPLIANFCGNLNDEMIKFFEDTACEEIECAVGYNIDKEELVKALAYDRHQYENGYQDGKAEAEQGTGWISVDDRLPEEKCHGLSKRVLVTDGEDVNIEWYDYHLKAWDCEGYSPVVDEKFWMSLPEPPETD